MSNTEDLVKYLTEKLTIAWDEDLLQKRLNNCEYSSVCLELSNISLKELALTSAVYPTCYWQNRESDTQYLALGQIHTVTNANELEHIEINLKNNNQLRYFGGVHFNYPNSDDEAIPEEWSEFPAEYFFLPQILFENRSNKTYVYAFYDETLPFDEIKRSTYLKKLASTFSNNKISHENNKIMNREIIPSFENWNSIINNCLDELKSQNFEKIVMARKEVWKSKNQFSPKLILSQLYDDPRESYIFFLQVSPDNAFITLSPEQLFSISEGNLYTDAIAGTRARGVTLEEDNVLGRELKNSRKELHEHRLVSYEIQNRLEEYCSFLSVEKHEELLKLKFVQHLHTIFKGILKEGTTPLKILNTLHPTPAVGGRPWSTAKEYLSKNEHFYRGLYAAPIGHLGHKDCEFTVGIRSALIHGNELHIFGGAGIVEGSLPESEWYETENKMKHFARYLWSN